MQTTTNGVESSARALQDSAEALTHRARRGIKRARREVADAVDSRLHDARRSVRHGRQAVEDAFDDVEKVIRSMPVRSVLLGLGIGAVLGVVTMLLAKRRNAPEL